MRGWSRFHGNIQARLIVSKEQKYDDDKDRR